MYLKKVTCPFFVKIDFLIEYDELGYGEQNLPGWQFFKRPEVRFSGHPSDVINDVIIRHPEKSRKIFSFKYTCIIYRWKGNFPVIKSLSGGEVRKQSRKKLSALEGAVVDYDVKLFDVISSYGTK